jgi:hypothetical protein
MNDVPEVPVYNEDGSIAGYIPIDTGPDFDEDEDGNQIRGNGVKRSIWDSNDNPANGYRYSPPKPPPIELNNPWSAPTPYTSPWSTNYNSNPHSDDDRVRQRAELQRAHDENRTNRGSVRHGGPGHEVKRRWRLFTKDGWF